MNAVQYSRLKYCSTVAETSLKVGGGGGGGKTKNKKKKKKLQFYD